jgi:hypothetical protein
VLRYPTCRTINTLCLPAYHHSHKPLSDVLVNGSLDYHYLVELYSHTHMHLNLPLASETRASSHSLKMATSKPTTVPKTKVMRDFTLAVASNLGLPLMTRTLPCPHFHQCEPITKVGCASIHLVVSLLVRSLAWTNYFPSFTFCKSKINCQQVTLHLALIRLPLL